MESSFKGILVFNTYSLVQSALRKYQRYENFICLQGYDPTTIKFSNGSLKSELQLSKNTELRSYTHPIDTKHPWVGITGRGSIGIVDGLKFRTSGALR